VATPTVVIDNVLGSDTAASGAGPAVALAGTAAATSASGLVVTLDGAPDLVNVATDGTHALWVATAAGRQYSPIAAKDNTAKTITVANAYAANLTGQAWGLGGRRATIDHANTRKLFSADILAGWTVDVQETGTDYLLTSLLAMAAGIVGTAGAPVTIASSSVNRPTIRTNVAGVHLFDLVTNKYWLWKHLAFRHAGSTRGAAVRANGNGTSYITFADCVFDGFATALDGNNGAIWTYTPLIVADCLFRNGTGDAILNFGATCVAAGAFLDNAGAGVNANGTSDVVVLGCTFARNGRGAYQSPTGATGMLLARGNLFHSQTLSAVEIGGAGGGANPMTLVLDDNVFWGNLGFGVRANGTVPAAALARRNAYGNNTSGARSANLAAGAGDITLTADPCVAAASNDFRLNAAAGGGALLRGIARTVGTLSPSSYPDLGPYQSAAAGGASVPPPPLQPGTFAYFG
jgi:hypothetical protein